MTFSTFSSKFNQPTSLSLDAKASMKSPLKESDIPDILIVDDMPDNIRFLASFLASRGYHVRKATSGKMALTAIQALAPDLILLDVKMPDMSGYEVCRTLKEDPETGAIPIIFLSVGDEVVDKVEAFQVGGIDYITKPFHLEEVLVRIQTQLTIRSLQKKLEEQNLQLQQALDHLKQAQITLVQHERMSTLKKVVAGVSHEVNNPLTFIFCNVEPARRHIANLLTLIELYQKAYPDASADIQSFIDEIDLDFIGSDLNNLMQSMRTGADRIRAFVLTLKSFTHLDESRIKQIDVHESIEEVLKILRYQLGSRADGETIQIHKNYDTLPLVTCYADQLVRVIFNLCVNAIDAIEAKLERKDYQLSDPQISIHTRLISDSMIQIGIKDNGIGIPIVNQSRLFEPFFTTKSVGQGLGLGLVTSRRIVEEMHRGQLTYNSAASESTEFVIQIPVKLL